MGASGCGVTLAERLPPRRWSSFRWCTENVTTDCPETVISESSRNRNTTQEDGLLGDVVSSVQTVEADGDGPLAHLLDLVLIGDVMSLHLAELAGVDPGPIPLLDDLKATLAETD